MRKRLFMAIHSLIAVAMLAPMGAVAQEAWLDDRLSVRKEIVLTPGAKGAGLAAPVGEFVFPLRLSAQAMAFDEVQDDGSDIKVADADGKRAEHYVESIDKKAGLAVVWVKGVNLDPAKTQTYHLYYGGKTPSVGNSAGVFGPSERLFIDFSKDAKDRTRNRNDVTGSVTTVSGFAGQAASLSGAPLRIAASQSLNAAAGAPFTLSMWIKPLQAQTAVLAQRGGAFVLQMNAGQLVAQVGGVQIASNAQVTPNQWVHVALVGDATGRINLFVGGRLAGQGAAQVPALAEDLILGSGFTGQMDSVRYASVARSADYIAAVAAADNGRGLVSFGAEAAQKGHFDVGYFVTVIENVTIEGWVVILLCAILLAIAIWVMVDKITTVGRIEKANRTFSATYERASSIDEAALREAARNTQASTIAQVYAAGLQEVDRRALGGRAGLTNGAIESMKARIDGLLTDQAYVLSNRLVLLTLAVSGGPFLGLLGTVIGVMITFAAIAAEGNVNVNSIAPGVAAALLATAAGLFVAIPALFGYNIILTRIKRINASTRSFADTLVARLSDQFSA